MTNLVCMVLLVMFGLIVLRRCVYQIADLNPDTWHNHPLKFIGMSLSVALILSGTGGAILQVQSASILLVAGMALKIVSDRRRDY